MSTKARIPREIAPFVPFMDETDDYQKAIDPVTTHFRYLNWGWTAAESAQYTTYRQQADALYDKWSDKKLRNTDITEQLHQTIDNTVKFDQVHHLLDRISCSPMPPAINTDFVVFKIKKGTPLADVSLTRAAFPAIKPPHVEVKKVIPGAIQLHVTNPDKPKSVARPKGIKEIEVWMAKVPLRSLAPADTVYIYVGEVKRGKYVGNFTDADIGMVAYFKVRYKNTHGEHSPFSPAISSTII
ncbi:MAG: hypothetical protein ABR968_00820 [Bacteroidales bacterium]|jgi:hypothetical protein